MKTEKPEAGKDLQRRTRYHYDDHPFDFLDGRDLTRIEDLQPKPFLEFARIYLKPGQEVADIGCGPGRATIFLSRLGMNVCAVDLSLSSLVLAQKRAPNACFINASNLNLPFNDMSFDVVVSDGVIHHTPDACNAFRENARVLRRGGHMYMAVYKRQRYYYYLYTYIGAPVRWLEKRSWGKALIQATLLPAYYGVHFLKSGGKRTWHSAKYLFYDYIITPRATFHIKEEIIKWGSENGLELVHYEKNIGNCHAFIFLKRKD